MKSNSFVYIIFLIIGFLQHACLKEDEQKEIQIEYEFIDDVSPVNTKLFVKEDLHWSQWTISDNSIINPKHSMDYIEHIFYEEGDYTVEIEATASGYDYFGKLEITTPPIANTFIINGFYFSEGLQFEINEDSLSIELDYFNSETYSYFKKNVSKSTVVNNDTVRLEDPIVIDITGFRETEYNLSVRMYFRIENQSESSVYFNTMFYVREKYAQNRIDTSPILLHLSNEIEGSNENITLLVDWTYSYQ